MGSATAGRICAFSKQLWRGFFCFTNTGDTDKAPLQSARGFVSDCGAVMTTLLTGISVGLGALVVLLLALLVVRWRSDRKTDERVAEVGESLNARTDEREAELEGARDAGGRGG